jgi:hypothetical protein
MWRLDTRARWAFVVITSMSGLFLFDGLQRKATDAVVAGIWLSIIVYLMLPKVRLAFSGGSISLAPAKGTSAAYRTAFNDDQVQRPVTRLQAKHFFTSRILEQARTDKTFELSSRELEFLHFRFRETATWATTHSHDGKLFTPRGLRLSTLLEHALQADRKNAAFPAEADAVYLRRWRALRDPWFKRMVVDRWYSPNPDVLLYDIVHRALGKHRAFWSSLDWLVAVFSVVACLLMIALFAFLAVFLKSQ